MAMFRGRTGCMDWLGSKRQGCMENRSGKRGGFKRLCLGVCSIALLSASVCFAVDYELTPGELLKKAVQQMRMEQYDEAIETMYMYLEILSLGSQDKFKLDQEIRFKLITLLIEADRLDEAVVALQVYIDHPLGEHPRSARSMLATCHYMLGVEKFSAMDAEKCKNLKPGSIKEFTECVAACTNALAYNEYPSCNAVWRELVPDEQEYTDEEITSLHMTMAKAYFNNKKWEECIDPYQYVVEHTKNMHNKSYAIKQMTTARIKIPGFDKGDVSKSR